ncbi:LysR family transcriptional regulator [Photobacterium sp. SDRW27]|uniref:LysR family transcriptional regulator n=1 Tax=Photobacterium obscurum TaxID=2829490 RepID=UPI0022442676|nr:LysR family transcriptional regulator [Photobacterium obscurum]MCW8328808.1 LysR family transcriptional regulator [Photobacterium obscurum]
MKLDDMELFVKVVEQGSFTKAADYCNIPKSTVSRRIRDLEQSLKTRLLERTTRRLHLTEVGEAFYHKAQQILQEVETTEKEIAQKQGDYSGKLTVYAPDYILELCVDHVAQFCQDYPDISLALHSDSQPQHLMAEKRFDLLLNIGTQPDSSFIARPLATLSYDYFASPSYLATYGHPESPLELHQLSTLALNQSNPKAMAWHFGQQELPLAHKYTVDSPYVLRSLTMAGQGICCLPAIMVSNEVKSNKLVRLFGGQYAFKQVLYGVYHSRRYVPNKVKLLLDEVGMLLQARIDSLEKSIK